MSANVELVRRVLGAAGNVRIERFVELLDPDVRFDLSGRVFNPAIYDGYEGLFAGARK